MDITACANISMCHTNVNLGHFPQEPKQTKLYCPSKEDIKTVYGTNTKNPTKKEKNYLANINTIYDYTYKLGEILLELPSHNSCIENLNNICNNALQSEVDRYYMESEIIPYNVNDECTDNDTYIYKSLAANAHGHLSELKLLLHQYHALSSANNVTKCDKRDRDQEMDVGEDVDVDIDSHIMKKVRM